MWSGTFSITYGVVADVASPAERGSFAILVSFAKGLAVGFKLCADSVQDNNCAKH